ncbi:MAG TPA: hypothetical protein VN366_05370, partial [Feifaniaceae bacterium]|nr:hypothetical protein [Feifaniaceae bacterium]
KRTYALVPAAVSAAPSATPSPTLPPGVSEDVFLSRLEDAGLLLREGDEGVCLIAIEAGEPEDALVLYAANGYVRGFSLTMQEPASEKTPSPKGMIGAYLKDKRQEIMEAQAARITELLPVLLAALTEENEFPRSTALVWADEAAAVLESGKSVSETKHGVSFAVLRTDEEQLLLSADLL